MHQDSENIGIGKVGAKRVGKTTRAALGSISNRNVIPTNKDTLKGGKKESRPILKSTLLRSTSAVQKENAVEKVQADKVEVVEVAPSSPGPMDISANSQGEEAYSKQLLNVKEIDKEDGDNPQLVSEYVNDIYSYMRTLERELGIKENYLEGGSLNGRMRGIMIDWLVQVHLRFHLLQETLYLTVAIIDRFLQEQTVSRGKLQLVGVTSMLIASKYEEMYAPEIADFVYITDNAYTKSDIRKMECLILKSLDFQLGRPLPLHFLRRNSKAGEVDAQKHTLAKYLMELTIVEYSMAHVVPSLIAAAALCFSVKILDNSDWTDTLVFYSKYKEADLMPVIKAMASLVLKAGTGKLTAIKVKYQSSKFMKISTLPELQSQTVQRLADGSL